MLLRIITFLLTFGVSFLRSGVLRIYTKNSQALKGPQIFCDYATASVQTWMNLKKGNDHYDNEHTATTNKEAN